jgi:hypothetical protein
MTWAAVTKLPAAETKKALPLLVRSSGFVSLASTQATMATERFMTSIALMKGSADRAAAEFWQFPRAQQNVSAASILIDVLTWATRRTGFHLKKVFVDRTFERA